MAGDVIQGLQRRIRELVYGAFDPAHDRFAVYGRLHITRLGGLEHAAFQGVAQIIVEHREAFRPLRPLFHAFHRGFAGGPGFPVYEDVRLRLFQAFYQRENGFLVYQTHQIEAEAVHFIFVDPVQQTINDKLAAHRGFRFELIAAAGTVPVRSVLFDAVIIIFRQSVKIKCLAPGLRRMVINHVHDNLDPLFMQGVDHRLGFSHPFSAIETGGVPAFWRIKIDRHIAPVVFRGTLVILKILKRHEMDGVHAQLGKVIDTRFYFPVLGVDCPRLGQTEVFTFALHTRKTIYGEVPDVHFIKNRVRRIKDGAGRDSGGLRLNQRQPVVRRHSRRVGIQALKSLSALDGAQFPVLAGEVFRDLGFPEAVLPPGQRIAHRGLAAGTGLAGRGIIKKRLHFRRERGESPYKGFFIRDTKPHLLIAFKIVAVDRPAQAQRRRLHIPGMEPPAPGVKRAVIHLSQAVKDKDHGTAVSFAAGKGGLQRMKNVLPIDGVKALSGNVRQIHETVKENLYPVLAFKQRGNYSGGNFGRGRVDGRVAFGEEDRAVGRFFQQPSRAVLGFPVPEPREYPDGLALQAEKFKI